MKPAVEKRALRDLETAARELRDLKDPFLLALARDDQPAEFADDPVSRKVERLVKEVLEIANDVRNALNFARHIGADASGFHGREASVPDCICCLKPAVPRPKRGMCGRCYMAYRRSNLHDVAEFVREWRAGNSDMIEDTTP